MTQQRVKRDGARDLAFRGELIGEGSHGTPGPYVDDWQRGTEVSIYLTLKGTLITAVRQWTLWENEADVHRAAVHETPQAAYQWLVRDCGGQLGRASKEAWEDACSRCSLLANLDVEEVA